MRDMWDWIVSVWMRLAKQVFGASKAAATASTAKAKPGKVLGSRFRLHIAEMFEDLPEKFDVVFDGVGESINDIKQHQFY